ncbi:MAG: glycosyltransferase family 4 protein, partial [Nanoarchaeota archaeon]
PHKKHQCVKTKNLVYAGTLRDIEGLDVLLDAFALIHTSYPDVKLYLVGGGKKDWLEKKAQHLGISSHVIFTGEVEHERVFDYLASAYLFVYPRKDVPYHHDIIGLKIYDAFDIHLPLVTSDVGELGSLVTTHRLGLVCKPEDPHDFARQVAKLLDDRKLYASLVSHLKHYQQRHTWKSVCSHLLPLYPRHTTMRTPKNL